MKEKSNSDIEEASLSEEDKLPSEKTKKKVEILQPDDKRVEKYIDLTKRLLEEERSLEKTKLRNNLLLGLGTLACVGLSVALIAFPPTVAIGIGLIIGSTTLAVVCNIGEYFHKKKCAAKLSKMSEIYKQREGLELDSNISLAQDKENNKVVFKNVEDAELGKIGYKNLKNYSKVNKFLEIARILLPKIGGTLKSSLTNQNLAIPNILGLIESIKPEQFDGSNSKRQSDEKSSLSSKKSEKKGEQNTPPKSLKQSESPKQSKSDKQTESLKPKIRVRSRSASHAEREGEKISQKESSHKEKRRSVGW